MQSTATLLYAHSQFLCSSVANLAFLMPDFENLFFLTPLAFWEIKKPEKSGFFLAYFQSDRLGSGKTLSELHIHDKSLVTKVYYHAGCTKYCKNFTVAVKMIDVIDEKQMHDTVITRKNMLLKIGLVSCRCFWRVLMSILCVAVRVLCVYASKLPSWLFCLFSVKTGWQPCCVVQQDSILQAGVCASQSSRTPMLDCSYSRRHQRSLILQL